MNQNVYRSSCASQKIGIDTPTIAKIMAARSATDRRRTADRMPIGIPRSSQITAAPIARTPVIGIRLLELVLHGLEAAVGEVHVLIEPEPRIRDEPLEEPPVLDVERLVQAEREPCVLDLLGSGGTPDRTPRRIAGGKLDEDEEGQERDDHDHEDHEEGSPDQVPAHLASFLRRNGRGGRVRDPLDRRVPRPRRCRALPTSRTPRDQRTGRTSSSARSRRGCRRCCRTGTAPSAPRSPSTPGRARPST